MFHIPFLLMRKIATDSYARNCSLWSRGVEVFKPESTGSVPTIIPETNLGAPYAGLECGDFDFGAWSTLDAMT
jgi:hypothetical protein